MEHSYFKDRISAFHDNELKNEERQLIAEHLEGCAECRQLLEDLQRFDAMVEKHSGLAGEEYWEEAAQKIEAAMGEEEKTEIVEVKRSSYWGLGWKLVGAAASVAIIAFIALYEGDIKREVDKRSQAAIEEPAAAADSVPDSVAGYVADLGGPETQPQEAKKTAPTENEIDKAEQGVVTNAEGEVFIRGGRASEETTIIKAAPETVPEQPPAARPKAVPDADLSKDQPVEKTLAPAPDEQVPTLSQIQLKQTIAEFDRQDSQPAPVEEFEGETEYSLDVDDDELALSLEEWRARRDSAQAVLSEQKRLVYRDAISAAQAPPALREDKKRLVAVVDSISKELEKEDPTLVLLECQYQIARLTDSKKEREEAVSFLRNYLEDEDSEYKLQAAFYLQQLDEQ